jgi:hypothetical protein
VKAVPQLLVACTRQRLPHAAALFGAQQAPESARHTSPEGHEVEPLTPQLTARWQLFVASPHCLPAHVVETGSGMQPHTLLRHATPASHEPQSMGWPQLSVV